MDETPNAAIVAAPAVATAEPPKPATRTLAVYQLDGETHLLPRFDGESVWLTQKEIAELFGTTKQNVSQHLKNAQEEELAGVSVVKDFFTTAADGKTYETHCYNLDAILSVGYRVKSPRGIQFRIWANKVLKERMAFGIRRRVPGHVPTRSEKAGRFAEIVRADAPESRSLAGYAVRLGVSERQLKRYVLSLGWITRGGLVVAVNGKEVK